METGTEPVFYRDGGVLCDAANHGKAANLSMASFPRRRESRLDQWGTEPDFPDLGEHSVRVANFGKSGSVPGFGQRVSVERMRRSSAKALFARVSRSFSRNRTLIASLPGHTVSSQFMPAAPKPV